MNYAKNIRGKNEDTEIPAGIELDYHPFGKITLAQI